MSERLPSEVDCEELIEVEDEDEVEDDAEEEDEEEEAEDSWLYGEGKEDGRLCLPCPMKNESFWRLS